MNELDIEEYPSNQPAPRSEAAAYKEGYAKGINDVIYALYFIYNGNHYPGLDRDAIGDWSGIEEAMHAVKKHLLNNWKR